MYGWTSASGLQRSSSASILRCTILCLLAAAIDAQVPQQGPGAASPGCNGADDADTVQQQIMTLHRENAAIEICLDSASARHDSSQLWPAVRSIAWCASSYGMEILWQQGAEPLRIPANANVTIHCYGAAISTFHAQGPVTMGHDSTLTFSECNLTTISSTVPGLWAEHNSPFSTFEGDHTATVILDNCVARFTHSEASILNHTGTSILADAAAGPDIEEVYTSGTGAWAATIANASSSARTLDIQFGRSPGPGVQQVFRNTVVWCAATWGASAQLVAALDTRGQPVLEADVTSAAACTECCGIKVRQGLSRGRTMGLGSLQAATTPAQAFAAVPVDFQGGPMGEALDSQTPSQQSGSSSVPRLVLILPLGIAAIALGILLVVMLRPLIARLRRRRRQGEYGIDMVTSGAGASASSADGKAAAASPGRPGLPHATRQNSYQNSIFLDSFASATEAPPPPTDVGYNDEESSEQGVESFKVYENSSFSPTT